MPPDIAAPVILHTNPPPIITFSHLSNSLPSKVFPFASSHVFTTTPASPKPKLTAYKKHPTQCPAY